MALLRIHLHLHLLLIAFSIVAKPDGDKTHGVIYRDCSGEEYNRGTPYETNLNAFLDSVAASEGGKTSLYFEKRKVGQVNGVFQCRGDISEEECGDCKRAAATRATVLCPGSVGARVQLTKCFLRYGNSKFFAAPDEQLVYKACSPQTTTDPGFFARRENVLTGLEEGSFSGNNFRVTSSGDSNGGGLPVYGEAQCEGDLSWPECADCVLNAATEVKRICDNSVAGKVFLQKCSVSYYQQDDSHAHHDTEANHVTAKTVAIVIGGVAAIVFCFIFLMFLRSLCKQAG